MKPTLTSEEIITKQNLWKSINTQIEELFRKIRTLEDTHENLINCFLNKRDSENEQKVEEITARYKELDSLRDAYCDLMNPSLEIEAELMPYIEKQSDYIAKKLLKDRLCTLYSTNDSHSKDADYRREDLSLSSTKEEFMSNLAEYDKAKLNLLATEDTLRELEMEFDAYPTLEDLETEYFSGQRKIELNKEV